MPSDPGSAPPGAGPPHPERPSGVATTPELWSALESLSAAGARPARLSHLLATISAQAARAFRASALVALPDAGGALVVRRGEGVLADCEGESLPPQGSLAGAAVAGVLPRLSAALAADPARPAEAAWAAGPALAFPLASESVAEGVVVVVRAPGEPPFTPADAEAAALLGGVAGAFLAAGRRYAEARNRPAAARPAARTAAPDPIVEAALGAEATCNGREPGATVSAPAGEAALPMPSVARALRHEINNSLGVIEAALQLVSREAAPMDRATHYELINTGADRLRGLVSRLAQLERDEGASAYVREDGALGIR
jgi:hypothetical protein